MMYQTTCSCKSKKKNGRTVLDCDNKGEKYCSSGCSGSSGFLGRCNTASQVCATTNLDDLSLNSGGTTYTLAQQCPAVVAPTYRTWKNRQQNSDAKEQDFFELAVSDNKAWAKATMLPKFYAATAQGIPAITAAWDANCNAVDPKKYYCLRYFPKCQNNQGSNSECMVHCENTMDCVTAVEAACQTANTANTALCISYATFGPNDGRTDCSKLCDDYQNDKLSASSTTTTSFVAVVTALIVAFA